MDGNVYIFCNVDLDILASSREYVFQKHMQFSSNLHIGFECCENVVGRFYYNVKQLLQFLHLKCSSTGFIMNPFHSNIRILVVPFYN